MLSERRLPLTLAHISLLLIGLMWVFPFLVYYHAYPLTAFYQEWSAAIFGLGAMILLASSGYWHRAELPRIVLLPIALMILVMVQFALGKIPYFGEVLLYALYLAWAALLIMLGARLRVELGLPAVATALAASQLVGAELSAAIGFIQHFQWHSFLDYAITMKISAAVYGNVAQQNHYADYETLGLVSLGLLYARGTLRSWQAALLAIPILFVLPLTGSREVWFYLLWLVLAALLWQRRGEPLQPLLKYSVGVLFGFGLMNLAIQVPLLSGASSSITSVQRLLSGHVHSGGIRLYLWHESWLIFKQFPLLGAGFGQYAWQHFLLAPVLHDTALSGLYDNAHNLVMQLAAEGGLTALFILFGSMFLWLRQAWRAERTIYHWWGYGVLAVLGIHSMLEYPLWYAYFLGIAALMLGMLDYTAFYPELRMAGRVFVTLVLLLGSLALYQLLSGYRSLENLAHLRPQSGNEAAYYDRRHHDLSVLQQTPMLQAYADLFDGSMIQVNAKHLAKKLARNDRTMRFVPTGLVAYRQAMLLAQNGEEGAAEAQMERAIWSYPGDFPGTETELRDLARDDAGHFSALLEFALRKHEEYQREFQAVHSE